MKIKHLQSFSDVSEFPPGHIRQRGPAELGFDVGTVTWGGPWLHPGVGQAAVRNSLGGFDGWRTRAQTTRHPQPLPACTGYPGASQELGSEIKNANKSSKAPL